jgi:hypothetical protein
VEEGVVQRVGNFLKFELEEIEKREREGWCYC